MCDIIKYFWGVPSPCLASTLLLDLCMARKPRKLILADNSFFHTMWRCHNKNWLLEWDWSKELYYDLLLKYKGRYDITFHSYHFMDNHIHLTGRVSSLGNFSNFFRIINGLFSRKLNERLKRCGQAIMERFLSPGIKDDRHMLAVMAYIDLNGVRAGKHEKKNWSGLSPQACTLYQNRHLCPILLHFVTRYPFTGR